MMASFYFNNISKWLIGIQPDSDNEEVDEIKQKIEKEDIKNFNITFTSVDSTNDEIFNNNKSKEKNSQIINVSKNDEDDELQILDDSADAVINLSKNVGESVFSFGKLASEHLYNYALQLKSIIENVPILEIISAEHESFLNEVNKKSSLDVLNSITPPWYGYNEEAIMKTLILEICKDQNNLLNGPSLEENFHFDYDLNYPLAMHMLELDPYLQDIRFKLVPKCLTEQIFWRNYFYKIHLIKKSVQLLTLDKINRSDIKDDSEYNDPKMSNEETSFLMVSNDLVVDSNVNTGEINDYSVINLNKSYKGAYELADWEQELVNEMANDPMVLSDAVKIPEDLEKELLLELEQHLKETQPNI